MKYIENIVKKPDPDFNQLKKVLFQDGKPDYVPLYELFVNREIIEVLLGRKVTTKADQVEFYYKAGYDYVPVWPHYKILYLQNHKYHKEENPRLPFQPAL